jgi:hypothetical protein
LYTDRKKKSTPLTRGVNLSVGRQAQASQPAAGRRNKLLADVHTPVVLTLQWVRGGGEPWMRVQVGQQPAHMMPGTLALFEAILRIKGWDKL